MNDEVETAIHIIREKSPPERGKTGLHLQRGEIAVADAIEVFIVAHTEEHLEQVQAPLLRSRMEAQPNSGTAEPTVGKL